MKQSKSNLLAPLVLSQVCAGFPSPATDFLETPLDLNELLILHPAATFFVRVKGDSMEDASIHNGDLLVVDRSLEVRNSDIVVAIVDGEFTVKQFIKNNNRKLLKPANSAYPEIIPELETEVEIWGGVSYVIHKTR